MQGKSALIDTLHFCITNGVRKAERTVDLLLLKSHLRIVQRPTY